MGRVTHADTQRMMTWLLANRKEPYFTVTVQSASAPFNYSFTPYITAGESFWVDWGDGNEETYATASTAEKSHEYSSSGTYTVRMLGSVGINRVRIAPVNAGQAALVIGSNGNLDKLGTITSTTEMFRACPNLVMTELTGGITSIDYTAFYGCTNLALTSLPEGVTSIGNYAFQSCINLALTSLPEGVTSIGIYAFRDCTNLALTSLPANVTSMGNDAFRGCTNLTLTSLPEGVTSIDVRTFYGCTNLALTSLPANVTSIGSAAFQGCTNLALTSLPEGLTSIGQNAFRGCTGLTNLIFLGTPTSIASNAFIVSGVNLYVPWSSGEVPDAPWGAASVTYDYTP
jgi:hypothetical protein